MINLQVICPGLSAWRRKRPVCFWSHSRWNEWWVPLLLFYNLASKCKVRIGFFFVSIHNDFSSYYISGYPFTCNVSNNVTRQAELSSCNSSQFLHYELYMHFHYLNGWYYQILLAFACFLDCLMCWIVKLSDYSVTCHYGCSKMLYYVPSRLFFFFNKLTCMLW